MKLFFLKSVLSRYFLCVDSHFIFRVDQLIFQILSLGCESHTNIGPKWALWGSFLVIRQIQHYFWPIPLFCAHQIHHFPPSKTCVFTILAQHPLNFTSWEATFRPSNLCVDHLLHCRLNMYLKKLKRSTCYLCDFFRLAMW